jgi:hypothetical protein
MTGDDVVASRCENDAPRPQVVRIGMAFEISQAFELAQLVVERLLADLQS